jgi:hypothetical protein
MKALEEFVACCPLKKTPGRKICQMLLVLAAMGEFGVSVNADGAEVHENPADYQNYGNQQPT